METERKPSISGKTKQDKRNRKENSEEENENQSYKTHRKKVTNAKMTALPWATTLNVSGSKLPNQNI